MSVKGEISDLKLHNVLAEIIGTWDLEKATAASIRRHLEDFADLSAPNRSFIREKLNMFFEEGEDDENEGKCTRTRKRKRRKEPERCIVSPELQDIVGEGPDVARAKAVKKIVVYGREKGLHERCFIFTDDKLKALFPGRRSIHIFQISNYLSLNGHIQPLDKAYMKLCIECKVKMRRTRRKIKTCECDHTHHSQKKDMQQKRNLLPRKDVRSWDTLPQDILVKILDCCFGPQKYWRYKSPSTSTDYASVSRSWKLAVLELVFPPTNGDVLDLRVLNSPPWILGHRMFCHYLRIVLNSRPASTWTTLHFPEPPHQIFNKPELPYLGKNTAKTHYFTHHTNFVERPYRQENTTVIKNDILPLIAEKTPELQNLYLPTELGDKIFGKMAPNWKNLRKVRMYTSAYNLNVLHSNCKFICELSLYGWNLDENSASILGNSFPNLKSLEIDNNWCAMTDNVLRLISDGHKNLVAQEAQQELLEEKRCIYRSTFRKNKIKRYIYRFAEADHVESSPIVLPP